jgi:hypothetical protein
MSEDDFHRILENKLDVKKAILFRRLKIDGGINGLKSA